ncbi:hypothetical protein ACVBEH_25450, partial [Roseateles sp. GG27B]
RWTTAKIAAIRSLAEHTTEHVRSHLPKIYSRELIDVLFAQPYCRISDLVAKGIAQRQAASRHLQQLVTLGILREVSVGKEKLFIHPKLMQLLSRDGNGIVMYGCHASHAASVKVRTTIRLSPEFIHPVISGRRRGLADTRRCRLERMAGDAFGRMSRSSALLK